MTPRRFLAAAVQLQQEYARLVGRNAINFHSPAHAALVLTRRGGAAEDLRLDAALSSFVDRKAA